MSQFRTLTSPAGLCAMIFSLWLPWAHVSCSQISTTPTYWQLADYDHRLYIMAALVAAVLLCYVWYLLRRARVAMLCSTVASLATLLAWGYLWLKRNDLSAYQTQMALQGGDIGRLLSELKVAVGTGFKLYLAGALLALAGSLSSWVEQGRAKDSP